MVTAILEATASGVSSAAVVRHRFVTANAAAVGGKLSVTHSGLNGRPAGVSLDDATAANEHLPIQIMGIAVVEAGEALSTGVKVGSLANGKVGTTSVTEFTGYLLDPAAGDGSLVRVRLF